MKNNIIQEKSYEFALLTVKIYKELVTKKEFILSKQLLRSGTSIGANTEEALGAQSAKDFISKISIAYKEAREVLYWLKLLKDSGYIEHKQFIYVEHKTNELLKILGSIKKTMLNKNNS